MSDTKLPRRLILATAAVAPLVHGAFTGARAHADPQSSSRSDEIRVSSLGHDPVNSTRFLQAAFDSDASTVIIDKVPGGWNTDPLFLRRSNVTVFFEPGAVLHARPGGFQNSTDRLFQIENCSDVTISGYGATIKMLKLDYRVGEWRNAMRLTSVSNVTVEGLTLRDSGGDGIGVTGSEGNPSRNILLRDLVCDNNRRNGLTIANVDGITVEGCALINTGGTAPQSGVDFEPDTPKQQLSNVRLRECFISGSVTSGILVFNGPLRHDSTPVDILVEKTTVGLQIGGSPQVMVWGSKDCARGTFELRDSLIHVVPNSSAIGTFGLPSDGFMTKLTRVAIWNLGNPFYVYHPITFVPRESINYGNLELTDSVLISDQPKTFISASGTASTTLTNVTGNITVINPNGADTNYGENTSNVTLNIRGQLEAPRTEAKVAAISRTVRGGENARFRFTRLGGDLTVPLTIAYETTGSARERYDYTGLGKVVVIPAGVRSVDLTIRTYPRRIDNDPRDRELAVAITSGPQYHSSGLSARTILRD